MDDIGINSVSKNNSIKLKTKKWLQEKYSTSILNRDKKKIEIGFMNYVECGLNNIQHEYIHAAVLINNYCYFLSFDWDENFNIEIPETYPLHPLSLSLKSESIQNATILDQLFYIGETFYNESEILEIGEKIISFYGTYSELYWQKDLFISILLECLSEKIPILTDNTRFMRFYIMRWQFPKSMQSSLIKELQNLKMHSNHLSQNFEDIINGELFFQSRRNNVVKSTSILVTLSKKMTFGFSKKLLLFPSFLGLGLIFWLKREILFENLIY